MEQIPKPKNKRYPVIAIIVLGCLFLLSLGGNGLGWKMHNDIVDKWVERNDSLISIQDTIIARYDNDFLNSLDDIQRIKDSKVVYINTNLKWKKRYEDLQKDYDVILYKLYSQHFLDSLAEHFLFRK